MLKAINENSFTVWHYLVKKGGPITGAQGVVLSEAMLKWGIQALESADSTRLSLYMLDKERALNLIHSLYELVLNVESWEILLDYLLINDIRHPKKKSFAYKQLYKMLDETNNDEAQTYALYLKKAIKL